MVIIHDPEPPAIIEGVGNRLDNLRIAGHEFDAEPAPHFPARRSPPASMPGLGHRQIFIKQLIIGRIVRSHGGEQHDRAKTANQDGGDGYEKFVNMP